MPRRRSWLGWILMPLGLFVFAIAGRLLFVRLTELPLHPNPQTIASVTQKVPATQWSDAADRTRSMIRATLAEQNVPGLSVAVGAGGEIVWAEGFGWADIESRVPVTANTHFRVGTTSAALTSAAAGMLIEQGRLKLDDEIQTYVPQFPKKQWPVTVRQLMAHTAGVSTEKDREGPLLRERCERPVDALQYFGQSALLFEPGTQYRHSSYGWILISAAIEAAANQPFRAFMRDQVFKPLGMNNTGAESAAEENPERIGEPAEDPPFATLFHEVVLKPFGISGKPPKPETSPASAYSPGSGYNPRVHHGLEEVKACNLSCYAGAMAFFSTAPDMARFGLAVHAGKLLQPSTVRALQTSQQLASGQQTGHGLGWDLYSKTLVGHDGALLGRRVASLMIFRDAGIVVAVMANNSTADISALALKTGEAFAHPASQGTDRP